MVRRCRRPPTNGSAPPAASPRRFPLGRSRGHAPARPAAVAEAQQPVDSSAPGSPAGQGPRRNSGFRAGRPSPGSRPQGPALTARGFGSRAQGRRGGQGYGRRTDRGPMVRVTGRRDRPPGRMVRVTGRLSGHGQRAGYGQPSGRAGRLVRPGPRSANGQNGSAPPPRRSLPRAEHADWHGPTRRPGLDGSPPPPGSADHTGSARESGQQAWNGSSPRHSSPPGTTRPHDPLPLTERSTPNARDTRLERCGGRGSVRPTGTVRSEVRCARRGNGGCVAVRRIRMDGGRRSPDHPPEWLDANPHPRLEPFAISGGSRRRLGAQRLTRHERRPRAPDPTGTAPSAAPRPTATAAPPPSTGSRTPTKRPPAVIRIRRSYPGRHSRPPVTDGPVGAQPPRRPGGRRSPPAPPGSPRPTDRPRRPESGTRCRRASNPDSPAGSAATNGRSSYGAPSPAQLPARLCPVPTLSHVPTHLSATRRPE